MHGGELAKQKQPGQARLFLLILPAFPGLDAGQNL
ncbi:hypothetical protein PMI07_005157 [Rhizobium sp. CF080]|nr:hypothetical protein PMI07_005157 [Rhizobium sp. CF080]